MHAPLRALLSAVCLVAFASVASADVNPTPIAVPVIGDQGAGSPYPSPIHLIGRAGPNTQSGFSIVLHAVTHPCPEDLAVLLVRTNGSLTNKYLLMSHAGGCRPLQGTDLTFAPGAAPIPDTEPAAPPYPSMMTVGPSNYGTAPVFPAPAPAGPYETVLPVSAFVEGAWDLYVIDTGAGHRGVIAGGWSIHYDTTIHTIPSQTSSFPIALPAGAPGVTSGPAAIYPIVFDLTSVPAGVKVFNTFMSITLSHTFPSDVTVILQGPSGDSVLVMSNAGDTFDITNVLLNFTDDAPSVLPSSGQITAGAYKPTAYGPGPSTPTPAPGPAPPYDAAFKVFNGQDVRGIWKLWVFDDFPSDVGSIQGATLGFVTEAPLQLTIEAPTTSTAFVANTPFVHVVARIPNLADSPHSATWRTQIGGGYYASGPMTFTPGSDLVSADIPMKRGTSPSNFVQIFAYDTAGDFASDDVDVMLTDFVYTLSEGATGGFFDLDVTMANPTGTDAPVTISFLPEHSAPIPFSTSVLANAQNQVHVNDLVPGDGVSTIVHSTSAIPLAIERTMSWDKTGYGGSGGTAIEPDVHWLFAEGSQGFFDTYVLLANDGALDAHATVKFLVEGGAPVNLPVVIAAHTRKTIYAGDVPAIVNTSFGIDILADQPITAERSMYFPHGGARVFEGGHESAGVNATSVHWFFAEGATGPFFECFILLSNPTATDATAHLTYLLPNGDTVPQTVTVPANGRSTIDVETVDPKLANVAVSTTITADIGIVAERSMYWPDLSIGWREAHNSVGVTAPALRWAVADGRLGGARANQTYILLANPNPAPAEVQVRFLKTGQAPVAKSYTLLPTSRLNIGPDETTPLLGEGVFSADVQVLNFQPIVVEKALYWNSGGEVWAAGTGTVGIPIPPPE